MWYQGKTPESWLGYALSSQGALCLNAIALENMHKPLVSVVIATYNRANIIGDTIDTILAQTYKNFELIIVDDGSTDKTEEVIHNYGDARIRYFKTDNWGGPARPRNIGIEKARGEYIAFCDDDDLWFSNKLEVCIAQMENNNMGVLFTDTAIIDQYSREITQFFSSMPRKFIANNYYSKKSIFLIFNNSITFSSVVVDKEILGNHRFSERKDLISAEDHFLWLQLNLKYPIHYLPKKLTAYRMHTNSISGSSKKKLLLNLRVNNLLIQSGKYIKFILYITRSVHHIKYYWREIKLIIASNKN